MPLETGTYVSDLDAANPLGGDLRSQGDNHLRLIKQLLKTTLPNASKAFRFPESVAKKTANFSITFSTDNNKLFAADTTSGAITVTLPDPTSGAAPEEDCFAFWLVKTAGANDLVLDAAGSQLLNGAGTLTIVDNYEFVYVIWSETDATWYVLEANRRTFTTLLATSIELGHATDTTLTRASAGDIAVEGNAVYRAGGTDVPVADGGTGRSTATEYAVLCGGTTTTNPHQSIAGVGTSGQVLTSNGAAALPTFQNRTGEIVAIIEDQQTSGTAAGTLASGTTTTRTLNTLDYNRDSLVSLSSNQFTLPAGTWEIQWWAPVGPRSGSILNFEHQSLLYNATDTTEVKRGTSGSYDRNADDGPDQRESMGSAVVTIASPKAFEIRHQLNAVSNVRQGYPASLGTEIYTRVTVRRA